MSNWVKNAIGLAIVLILLVLAWRFLQGDGGEVTVMESGVKINQRSLEQNGNSTLVHAPATNNIEQNKKVCRLPANGIDSWDKIEKWTADSGWRRDRKSVV